MALSEREQKVLDQLEELMSNEDPHFCLLHVFNRQYCAGF